MRLMIVDDSMIIRNRIAILANNPKLGGVDIVGLASDGEQALEIARKKLPDAITMDLTMPNMDGEECIGHLAELLPEARILVVSALSDRATALRAIRNGAHGFLLKPFRDEELLESLVELMQ